MMTKLIKIFVVLSLFSFQLIAQDQSEIYFKTEDLLEVKSSFQSSDSDLKTIIKHYADRFLDAGPWNITESSPSRIKIDPHYYFTESPYWWPNPDDPEGSYIRKDGVRNPDRFLDHKEKFMKVYQTVSTLALASFLFDNESYALKAFQILDMWFVNEKTKMNPDLKYAQLIRGRDEKRGVGIIETHRLTRFVEMLNLLRLNDRDNVVLEGVEKWMSQYLKWLVESEYGVDEKERGNNHSSWYAAQIAALSSFTNNNEYLNWLDDYTKEFLIDNQITQSGTQPYEEERTLSLSYSVFNLDALSFLSVLLSNEKNDIWRYSNDGGSLVDAINYLTPFLLNQTDWPHKQIKKYNGGAPIFWGLYAVSNNDVEKMKLFKELFENPSDDFYDTQNDPFKVLLFLVIDRKINKY
ncbi:MAG: alginate lyase family protein [Melioribacteraceae bacterium]|nr:alginate lyase family protein [Melioribacteraceae bacterium]